MTTKALSPCSFQLAGDLSVNRLGYGAMRLAGPGVWGPPRDPDAAIALLREAITLGINHIDTSDFYGPHTVNQLIRQALHPYPKDLVIITKVGARRAPDRSWPKALSRDELTSAIHDNLRNLGLEALDVVNLRVGTAMEGPLQESIAEPFGVLAELGKQGLIRHLGLSNVTPEQLTEAQSIAPVVCVQNHYNLAHRADEALLDTCAAQGIAFTPYFPLGGFTPLQSSTLEECSGKIRATPMQIALAWLLQRSPNILLIPGSSSVRHLRDNVAAATLHLPADIVDELNKSQTQG
jgi:pyridoxine 4-dehydrogenase